MSDDLISRQAAIDALERIFDRCEEIEAHLPEGDPDRTGYKMFPDYMTVWKYLHQLPSAQPEKCEDCWNINKTRLLIPQPERKTGQWIAVKIGNGDTRYTCSECGASYECDSRDRWDFNFCPNCGSQMDERSDHGEIH